MYLPLESRIGSSYVRRIRYNPIQKRNYYKCSIHKLTVKTSCKNFVILCKKIEISESIDNIENFERILNSAVRITAKKNLKENNGKIQFFYEINFLISPKTVCLLFVCLFNYGKMKCLCF